MARGGFCKLPGGTVVVALTLPRPAATADAARHDAAPPDGVRGAPGAPGAPRGASPQPGAGAPDATTDGGEGGTVRVLVHAVNRSRALTRLRNLGLRSVYLRGNTHPPTPDEVTAVLHHPDGLIWRTAPLRPDELWHPIRALFARPAPDAPGAPAGPGDATSLSAGSDGASAPSTARRPYSEAPLTVPVEWTTATGHESGGLTGA